MRRRKVSYIDFEFLGILCSRIEVYPTGLFTFTITTKGFEKLVNELLHYAFEPSLILAVVQDAIIVRSTRSTVYLYINDLPSPSRLKVMKKISIDLLARINRINEYTTSTREIISFKDVQLKIKYVSQANSKFSTGYDWKQTYSNLKMKDEFAAELANAVSPASSATTNTPTPPTQITIQDIQNAVAVLQVAYRMNPDPLVKLKIDLYQMSINAMLRVQGPGTTTQTTGKIVFEEPKFKGTIDAAMLQEYKQLRDTLDPIDVIKAYENASVPSPYVNMDIRFGTERIYSVEIEKIRDSSDNYGFTIPRPIPLLANTKNRRPGNELELQNTNIVYIIRCQSDPKKIIELYEAYTSQSGDRLINDGTDRATMKLSAVLDEMRAFLPNP